MLNFRIFLTFFLIFFNLCCCSFCYCGCIAKKCYA